MKGKEMKANWFLGAALAVSALSAPAFGQVSIGVMIGTPPPPVRYEVPPPPPEEGYVWMQGYWAPDGPRYVWAPGHWMRPPYYGAAWHPAYWEHHDNGYRYHGGYWEHHDNGRHRGWYKNDQGEKHGHGHGHGHGHDD